MDEHEYDQKCRTCGERYPDAGDGYDGECPDCADASAARDEQEASAVAHHAVVRLLIPPVDRDGKPIDLLGACDYVAETLRGLFLDWAYFQNEKGPVGTPRPLTIVDPYVEGDFTERSEL